MLIGQIKVQKASNNNILAKYAPIIRLGLQGPPGTKFKINNSDEITMNEYGVYELDLTNTGAYINSLEIISINENKQVLIDIIYLGQGGEN